MSRAAPPHLIVCVHGNFPPGCHCVHLGAYASAAGPTQPCAVHRLARHGTCSHYTRHTHSHAPRHAPEGTNPVPVALPLGLDADQSGGVVLDDGASHIAELSSCAVSVVCAGLPATRCAPMTRVVDAYQSIAACKTALSGVQPRVRRISLGHARQGIPAKRRTPLDAREPILGAPGSAGPLPAVVPNPLGNR